MTSTPRLDMSKYGQVAMNQLEPGRIVFAHVPFHDDPRRSKTRPTVVIERSGRIVTVCPMYTNEREGRIETYLSGRRCYVDLRAIELERYQLVNLHPQEVDDETWDYIADHVIWPTKD